MLELLTFDKIENTSMLQLCLLVSPTLFNIGVGLQSFLHLKAQLNLSNKQVVSYRKYRYVAEMHQ